MFEQRFLAEFVSREDLYSFGKDRTTGKLYVGIPVRNPYVSYEEYYEVPEDIYQDLIADRQKAREFVARCRSRELGGLLILKPGSILGEPIIP